MPQMSPMNWVLLYIMFLFLLFFSFIMIYFYMNVTLFVSMKKYKLFKKLINKW